MLDRTYLRHYGWRVAGMGGGCEAYTRFEASGDVWVITHPEGSSLPVDGGPCVMGHYATEDDISCGEPDGFWKFRNVSEANRAVLEIVVGLAMHPEAETK